MEVIYVYIYGFLVVTGAIAIIISLRRLADTKSIPPPSDSHIQTLWFKMSAPAGLIYGLTSILLVIFLVKTDRTTEYERQIADQRTDIKSLSQEVEYLRAALATNSNDTLFTFTLDISSIEARPIFGGRVLVVYQRNVVSKSTLTFKGAKGVSLSSEGPFDKVAIEFEEGDKFYLKTDGQLWGVNVVDEGAGVRLQFYKA